MIDKTWTKQDADMAKVLRDYGFIAVFREGTGELRAARDTRAFGYELPQLCFSFILPYEAIGIDALVAACEERCK